jgi:uncharacterized membrane protein YfcA
VQKTLLIFIGLTSGLINGLLGIGGGTILIPAMVFLLKEEQHLAHGTSLSVILPTAVVSAFVYQTYQQIDWTLVIKITVSAMLGGYLGARLMQYIPGLYLRKIFAGFILIAGLKMLC